MILNQTDEILLFYKVVLGNSMTDLFTFLTNGKQ